MVVSGGVFFLLRSGIRSVFLLLTRNAYSFQFPKIEERLLF